MRTTITLDDYLLEEAKIAAVKRRASLSSVIEAALRMYLDDNPATQASPVALPVYGGSGVRSGADLDDFQGLAELLEEAPGNAPA